MQTFELDLLLIWFNPSGLISREPPSYVVGLTDCESLIVRVHPEYPIVSHQKRMSVDKGNGEVQFMEAHSVLETVSLPSGSSDADDQD